MANSSQKRNVLQGSGVLGVGMLPSLQIILSMSQFAPVLAKTVTFVQMVREGWEVLLSRVVGWIARHWVKLEVRD